jgi:hypothetical protein
MEFFMEIVITASNEQKASRAARLVGLVAKKSRSRITSSVNHGGFMLLDPHTNRVVSGERFDLGPAEVIAYCKSLN